MKFTLCSLQLKVKCMFLLPQSKYTVSWILDRWRLQSVRLLLIDGVFIFTAPSIRGDLPQCFTCNINYRFYGLIFSEKAWRDKQRYFPGLVAQVLGESQFLQPKRGCCIQQWKGRLLGSIAAQLQLHYGHKLDWQLPGGARRDCRISRAAGGGHSLLWFCKSFSGNVTRIARI